MKKLIFVMFGFMIVFLSCEDKEIILNGARVSPNEIDMFLYVFPSRQPAKDTPPQKLYVHFYPDNATNQEIHWKVSDENIITITQDGVVTPVALGEAYAVAYQGEEALDSCRIKVSPFVRVSINLLENTGFEIGPDAGNTSFSSPDVAAWENVESEWFEWRYPGLAGTGYGSSLRINSLVGSWWTGNGSEFTKTYDHVDPPYTFVVGQNICRTAGGGNATGGFYQIVKNVIPEEIYKIGGRTAARAGNATDIPNFKTGVLMVLSPDGKEVYAEFPLDYEKGDGTEGLTMYNTRTTVYATYFVAEKIWTAPPGVDKVRFQYVQRNFSSETDLGDGTMSKGTPIICWDEMFFQLYVEENSGN